MEENSSSTKELEGASAEKFLGPVSPLYVSKKENEDASMSQVSPLYVPNKDKVTVESAVKAKPSQENGARKPCITPGFRGSIPEESLQTSMPNTHNEGRKVHKKKSSI